MGKATSPLQENLMPTTDVQIDEKIKVTIQEPKQWKVILLNDETTPIEFVIQMLTQIFKHSEVTAKDITIQVHETGSGIAGVYSFEIAEAKAVEATSLARGAGFPLQIKLEEE